MWSLLVQIFIDYQSITEIFGKNVVTFGPNLVRFLANSSNGNFASKILAKPSNAKKRTTPFLEKNKIIFI